MISPSIGRVVWFHMTRKQRDHLEMVESPYAGIAFAVDQPMAALVVYVHGDRCVNLAGFDHNGASFSFTSVTLLQDNELPGGNGMWAEWMPYQKAVAEGKLDPVIHA